MLTAEAVEPDAASSSDADVVLVVAVAAFVVAPEVVVVTFGVVLLASRVEEAVLVVAVSAGSWPEASRTPISAPAARNRLTLRPATDWRIRRALRRIAARRERASARALSRSGLRLGLVSCGSAGAGFTVALRSVG